jgi:hypothetical protein
VQNAQAVAFQLLEMRKNMTHRKSFSFKKFRVSLLEHENSLTIPDCTLTFPRLQAVEEVYIVLFSFFTNGCAK